MVFEVDTNTRHQRPVAAGGALMSIVSASHIGAAASRGRPPGAAGKSLVFNEDFIDLTGIDLADTRAGGFKFYPKQWFGGGATPTASIVQIAPSVVRLGQRPGTNYGSNRGRIQTASTTSEGSYFGNMLGEVAPISRCGCVGRSRTYR